MKSGRFKNIFFSAIIGLSLPLISFAALNIGNPLKYDSFAKLVDGLFGFIITIAVAVAPIIILYAGFIILSSGGEPEKMKTAKNTILYTVIGLAILFLGKGLIAVIRDIFQVKGP